MSAEHPHEASGDPPAPKRAHPVTSLSLLHRARAREQAAWDRLFFLYRPLVLYWCGRWGVPQPDGDDVAQDVFRELADALDDFEEGRPGGSFRAWLRGVTRNRLLMHLRRAGKQTRAEGGSSARARLEQIADGTAEDEDDPGDQLGGLYRRALELVRSEFEERTWQTFWRVVVDGRTPAQVAAELGVSDAAVRQAKSRVLRRLKEEVGDLIH